MRRRRFLKLVGLTSLAAMIRLPLASVVSAAEAEVVSCGGRLYRSDGTGQVYVSVDSGEVWALHSNLGPECSVTGLAADQSDMLHATVGFASWEFELLLAPDLTSWLTA